jgi:hypothetical protein
VARPPRPNDQVVLTDNAIAILDQIERQVIDLRLSAISSDRQRSSPSVSSTKSAKTSCVGVLKSDGRRLPSRFDRLDRNGNVTHLAATAADMDTTPGSDGCRRSRRDHITIIRKSAGLLQKNYGLLKPAFKLSCGPG